MKTTKLEAIDMKYIFIIILIYFIIILIPSYLGKGGTIIFGEVTLSGSKTVNLKAKVKKSLQSWRFRFDSDPSFFKDNSPAKHDMVSVRIENTGDQPINLLLPAGKEFMKINPMEQKTVFEGSVYDLLMMGRTVQDEFSINSTQTPGVEFQFHLTPKNITNMVYVIRISAVHDVELF